MNNQAISATQRSLLSIRDFTFKHPTFKESTIRWLIFNEKLNGFTYAIVRIGRRIYIDEEKFFEWVDDQSSGPDGVKS
ncbi:MAG: hypothetical protein ABW082_14255 [Sedimenticola sp.]